MKNKIKRRDDNYIRLKYYFLDIIIYYYLQQIVFGNWDVASRIKNEVWNELRSDRFR